MKQFMNQKGKPIMTITEIRAITGLKMTKFAEYYKIPYRTLQDWEAGKSNPPAYLLEMLERLVKIDFTKSDSA